MSLIKKYSVNDHWVALQDAWVNGQIGTKECLAGQLRGVRISKKELEQYLATAQLDKSCYKLLSFLNAEGVRPVILSDAEYEYVFMTGSNIPVRVPKNPISRPLLTASPVRVMSTDDFETMVQQRGQTAGRP